MKEILLKLIIKRIISNVITFVNIKVFFRHFTQKIIQCVRFNELIKLLEINSQSLSFKF